MAKDIEKLIEEFVIPEMEYSPSYEKKNKGKGKGKNDKVKTVTIDEIPEVVLPKTKAEVYQEAKGRLNQKTSAVSRRTKRTDAQTEVAATKPVAVTKPEKTITRTRTVEMRTVTKTPTVAPASDPVWVGGADELVPFAWRMPLIPDIARPSKYYKQAVRDARALMLPVPHTSSK